MAVKSVMWEWLCYVHNKVVPMPIDELELELVSAIIGIYLAMNWMKSLNLRRWSTDSDIELELQPMKHFRFRTRTYLVMEYIQTELQKMGEYTDTNIVCTNDGYHIDKSFFDSIRITSMNVLEDLEASFYMDFMKTPVLNDLSKNQNIKAVLDRYIAQFHEIKPTLSDQMLLWKIGELPEIQEIINSTNSRKAEIHSLLNNFSILKNE